MSKKVHYLLLLLVLIFPTGCATVHGMGEDINNVSDPNINGWDAIQKADAWIQQNMW